MASEPLVIPEDLKIVYGVVCDGHKVSPSSPYIRKLIERIAALEAQLDALRAENTNIRAIDKGRVELVAALRALLEKFDKAAEAILEDGGCIHDQAPVICDVCEPFIAARKEYALIAAPQEPA